jgi:hypothetical protein
MKPAVLDEVPPGAWAECHESVWIQGKIFLSWFKRFIQFSRASKNNYVLLLLDGHASHTKTFQLIDLARGNRVVLLCSPPRCTDCLQPLDAAFMKPLSTYCDSAVTTWLRAHPARVINPYQVGEIFGTAFIRAATITSAVNGFRQTGIWLLDPNVFTDDNFLPAETTNNPADS